MGRIGALHFKLGLMSPVLLVYHAFNRMPNRCDLLAYLGAFLNATSLSSVILSSLSEAIIAAQSVLSNLHSYL